MSERTPLWKKMGDLPPTPWKAEEDEDGHWDVLAADGFGIACFPWTTARQGELARLWAAAPDLLAALTEALPYLMDNLDERGAGEWRVVEAAVRAVCRATGQEVGR